MIIISDDVCKSKILEITETMLIESFQKIPGCSKNDIYESEKIPGVIFIKCGEMDCQEFVIRDYFIITDKEFLSAIKKIRWEEVRGYVRRGNRRSVNLHRYIIDLEPGDSDKAHHMGPLWDNRKHMIMKVTESEHKKIHKKKRKPLSLFVVSDEESLQKLKDYILNDILVEF